MFVVKNIVNTNTIKMDWELFAKPWWVNLLFLAPIIALLFWRKNLSISLKTLFFSGIFGAAFGFVECSVVVYLRGSVGLLAQRHTNLPDSMIAFDLYRRSQLLSDLPNYLLTIEMYREAATMIMLASVAILAHRAWSERWAIFFWMFAFWDIFYYVGLKLSISWPRSLTDSDVLFLLPVPWLAQVWFPISVSFIFILAVFFSRKKLI